MGPGGDLGSVATAAPVGDAGLGRGGGEHRAGGGGSSSAGPRGYRQIPPASLLEQEG